MPDENGKFKKFLSFGAGVQTTAMVLIPEIMNEVDEVIFSDTGGEHPETYEFLEKYTKPYLESIGKPLVTVRMHNKLKDYATGEYVEVKSLRDAVLTKHQIPNMFTRWCTAYSKVMPIIEYLRKKQTEGVYAKPAIGYLGISIDEAERQFVASHPEYSNYYPLIHMNISRDDCKDMIRKHGWEVPVKSGCYYCPFQGAKEWRHLHTTHPDLFQDSIMLEEQDKGFPTFTLNASGIKLRDMGENFSKPSIDSFTSTELEEGEGCLGLACEIDETTIEGSLGYLVDTKKVAEFPIGGDKNGRTKAGSE